MGMGKIGDFHLISRRIAETPRY